ncbi:MAG: hypothetical protein GF308_00525 [Candidatus Heimdallarchaeota archaeon]|nr:hypothetical protein [Candidatus Heimdallarchaeota archaeon]
MNLTMDRLADSAEQLSEQPSNHSSSTTQPRPIYNLFSVISFSIGIISLGVFSWISMRFIGVWFISYLVSFSLFSLFIVISLCGIVLGALSLNKEKKWLAVIGTAFSTTGTLWLMWGLIILLQFFY